MRVNVHSTMLHAETRKRALSLALTSAPVLGGVLLAVWLLKRRRRGNRQGKSELDQEPVGAASGDEVSSQVSGHALRLDCAGFSGGARLMYTLVTQILVYPVLSVKGAPAFSGRQLHIANCAGYRSFFTVLAHPADCSEARTETINGG